MTDATQPTDPRPASPVGVEGPATWARIDDEGYAEVRVNGERITTVPSYGGAEEVCQRINAALSAPSVTGEALDEVVNRLSEVADDCEGDINSYMMAGSVAKEHAADIRTVLAALSTPEPAGEVEGEAVAWPETLDWSMVDSGAICHWRATFGDYTLDVTQGHDKVWAYRVNNTGRLNFDGLEAATAAAMEDLKSRLSIRWAAALKTMSLYTRPSAKPEVGRETIAALIRQHVKARPSSRVMPEWITGTYDAADAILAALTKEGE